MNKADLAIEIATRIKKLAKEKGVSLSDLRNKTLEFVNNNGENVLPSTVFSWFRGSVAFSIGGLIAVAKELDVSVSLLLGEHDVPEIKIDPSATYDGNIEAALKEYMLPFGTVRVPIKEIGLSNAWWWKFRHQSCITARPEQLLKLSRYTGFTVDYFLGMNKIKYWQEFAFEHEIYHKLPSDTLFYFPESSNQDMRFGFLSPDAKAIQLSSGLLVPFDMAKKEGVSIVIKSLLANGSWTK